MKITSIYDRTDSTLHDDDMEIDLTDLLVLPLMDDGEVNRSGTNNDNRNRIYNNDLFDATELDEVLMTTAEDSSEMSSSKSSYLNHNNNTHQKRNNNNNNNDIFEDLLTGQPEQQVDEYELPAAPTAMTTAMSTSYQSSPTAVAQAQEEEEDIWNELQHDEGEQQQQQIDADLEQELTQFLENDEDNN